MRNKYARVKDNKVLIQNLLKKKFNTKRIHTGPKQNSSNSMHNIIERERERERNLYLIRFQRRILFNLHAAKKRVEVGGVC